MSTKSHSLGALLDGHDASITFTVSQTPTDEVDRGKMKCGVRSWIGVGGVDMMRWSGRQRRFVSSEWVDVAAREGKQLLVRRRR
jgi:hypothetical protein